VLHPPEIKDTVDPIFIFIPFFIFIWITDSGNETGLIKARCKTGFIMSFILQFFNSKHVLCDSLTKNSGSSRDVLSLAAHVCVILSFTC
jgi:hypothetical protein